MSTERARRALERMAEVEAEEAELDERIADGTATVDDFRARLHPKPYHHQENR